MVPEAGLSTPVALAVLAAALLHAGWNALIRGTGDKVSFTLLLSFAGSGLSIFGVAIFGWPAVASWPFLATSVVLHTVYIYWLIRAYEGGGLVTSYTIMRGVPPMLIALASGPVLGEALQLDDWLGIALVSSGVIGVGTASGHSLRCLLRLPATRAALLNAVAIAAYSIIDGYGARLSGNPLSYAFTLFLFEPICIIAFYLKQRGMPLLLYFRAHWRLGLLGALGSMGAYSTVLWAMTLAPIALVAALRETSVLFAILIGCLWFREGKVWRLIAAASVVIAGIILLRL